MKGRWGRKKFFEDSNTEPEGALGTPIVKKQPTNDENDNTNHRSIQ